MTTEPTPQPTFFQVLVTNRQQVAIGLGVVGVVFAALAIWWGVWGFARGRDAAKDETPAAKKLPDLMEKEKPAEEKKDDRPAKSPDYRIACIWAGGLALLSLLSAGWLFTQAPDPTAPLTTVRAELLAYGGTAGFLTAVAGLFLGYSWHQSLVRWVGGGDSSEAKWVFYAMAVFLAGLLIMFASLQLARSEQRTNATLRRVLYGYNSVFVGLLLLVLLIAINIISFIEVPKVLVANEAAFTGLSDESKTFLRGLDRPVHAYLILPESHQEVVARNLVYDNLYSDCRGLLSQCEDHSRNFHATYLSPAFDAERIAALLARAKIQAAERQEQQYGLLVTVGEDEAVNTFIPAGELVEIQRTQEGGAVVFQGEHRLMMELMFLVDSRSKEKVYFTKGHGELSIEAGADPSRSASEVVRFLRDRKMTVETLNIDATNASVPDDAAAVVVAGPQETFTADDPVLAALREYVRRKDRPGKLVLLLPAFRTPEGKVAPTGLESLTAELGVDVDARHRVVSAPGQVQIAERTMMPPDCVLVGPYPRSDTSLGKSLGRNVLIFLDARPVTPAPPGPGSTRKASPALGTGLRTWQEEGFRENLVAVYGRLRTDPALKAEKQFHERGEAYSVAVVVTDPVTEDEKTRDRPRAIVFGSDSILIDQPPVPAGIEELRQQLFSDSLDWLRERDKSIGIPPRKLPVYMLDKPIEWSSQFVLLLMILLGIGVLGGGVWLSRRR